MRLLGFFSKPLEERIIIIAIIIAFIIIIWLVKEFVKSQIRGEKAKDVLQRYIDKKKAEGGPKDWGIWGIQG